MAATVKLHIRPALRLLHLRSGMRRPLLTTASLVTVSQPTVSPRTGSHRLIRMVSRSTDNRGMERKAMDSRMGNNNMGSSSTGSNHILMVAIASRLKLKRPELLMRRRRREATPLNNLHMGRAPLLRVPTD